MRLSSRALSVFLVLSCASVPIACATAVDDGVPSGGRSDTGRQVEDTTGGGETATDGGEDGTVAEDSSASDVGSTDTRDAAPGVDSTVRDSGIDTGTFDSGVDTTPPPVDTGGGTGSLLISEIQTRGSNGGNDEFIEIYNAGTGAVVFDSTWTIAARSAAGSCGSNAQAVRYTGTGQVIGPHRHLLLTNNNSSSYDGAVVGDDTYTTGIPDAASVMLFKGSTLIDALCFYYDPASLANLSLCPLKSYTCEGTPVTNLPHNDGTGTLSNADVTLDRKPGGGAGNGTDTNDSSSDFSTKIANPQNLSSTAVP